MRFVRFLVLDITQGMRGLIPLYAAAIFVQTASVMVLQSKAVSRGLVVGGSDIECSLGDCLLFSLAGIREYAPDEIPRMPYPFGWVFGPPDDVRPTRTPMQRSCWVREGVADSGKKVDGRGGWQNASG